MAVKSDFILAEVDGEGMMIDVEKGTSLFLNETGLLIFKMRQEGKSFDEIKSVLLEEYDVDEREAEQDIRAFLTKLDKKVALR
jgi:hypothetical protein